MVIRQDGAQLSAAIMRVDGDTGTLSGSYKGGTFTLGHFFGAGPMRLEVTPSPDGSLKLVEDNGFDSLHMSFYKNMDIGKDEVWDVWQLEGPAMIWYFRGAPHVHTWVHIREKA